MKAFKYILIACLLGSLFTAYGYTHETKVSNLTKWACGLDTLKPKYIVFYSTTDGKYYVKPIKGSLDVDTSAPVNPPPVADAGPDSTLVQGATLTLLDGSGSHAQGSATISSYTWTQTGGTTITIMHPNSDTTTIGDFKGEGDYIFNLHVEDNNGLTDDDQVTITIPPLPVNIYYITDSQIVNFAPYAQTIPNATTLYGRPDSAVISATLPNGWGVSTVSTNVWLGHGQSTSGAFGEPSVTYNDYGPFWVDSALVSTGFVNDGMQFNGTNWNLELTHLDPHHLYRLEFFSSRKYDASDTSSDHTWYTIQDDATGGMQTRYHILNSWGNTSKTVVFDTVTAASDSIIRVCVAGADSTDDHYRTGFLSGMRIYDITKNDSLAGSARIALFHYRDSGQITLSDGSTPRKALIYYPQYGYDSSKRYPVIVYLAGQESSGTDLELVRQFGVAQLEERNHDLFGIKPNGDTMRFVVIAPQWNHTEFSFTAVQLDSVVSSIKDLYSTRPIDTSQIFMVGFSSGAGAAMLYAFDYPGKYKAIATMSAGAYPTNSELHTKSGVFAADSSYLWIQYHTDQYTSVNMNVMDSVRKYSPDFVKYTWWSNRGHNGWNYEMDTSWVDPAYGQNIYDFFANPAKNTATFARFNFKDASNSTWLDSLFTPVIANPGSTTISVTDPTSGFTISNVISGWNDENNQGYVQGTEGSWFGYYTVQSAWYNQSKTYSANGNNLKFTNLKPNTTYVVTFMGSRKANSATNISKYGVNGANFKSQNNTDNDGNTITQIEGTSDASGVLWMSAYRDDTVTGGSGYGYLNGLMIREK